MLGETRDEGDSSGAWGRVSKRRHLPRFLICYTQTHLFMSSDAFESRRKMSCHRPQPISLTTTTQGRNMSFRRPDPPSLATSAPTYSIRWKLRPHDWSNTPPPSLLDFVQLAGAEGVSNVGESHVGTNETAGPAMRTTSTANWD